jgi:mRNA interferase MazF
MSRGDILWVDFGRARGAEAAGRRPAVLVGNDGAIGAVERLGYGVVTVIPLTSNTARLYPFQVHLPADRCNLQHDSKAQTEQVRSVAMERIGAKVGRLPADLLDAVDDAIRLHLALA